MSSSICISHFEKLKKSVLVSSDIVTIGATDCKRLSLLIARKTGGSVSETTLKRIYGFAISRFFPSMYTLNQLAKYCGYADWSEFSSQESGKQITDNTDSEWLKIRRDAEKITDFTIKALQHKSGIPYSQTISRKFIDEQIDHLSSSNATCSLISAPSGYGKTIGLCHWASEKMENVRTGKSNDIVLFFSNDALLSALLTGRDMNDWMLHLLGFGNHNEAEALLSQPPIADHKFYLVIDGLDEFSVKNEQFKILADQVKVLLSTYKNHSWFKVILSMRPSTWNNNRHLMEPEDKKISTGFFFNDRCINVPLFDPHEIIKLAARLNPAVEHQINMEWLENFQYPLFFQYYYKINKDNFTLSKIGHLLIYDLVSNFILNKIYLSNNADEKLFLLHRLVLEMDPIGKNFTVEKLKLSPLIKHYHQAYTELLSIGFITEVNNSEPYHYNTYITFANRSFLEYSIAKAFLIENEDRFDHVLVNRINTELANNEHKLAILKWCIMHAIKTGQQESYEQLTEVILTPNEKSELVLFLGELLDQQHSLMVTNEALQQYFSQDFNDKLFDYFFGLELVTINYQKTLRTLLKFKLSDRKKIIVYTALGTIGVIKLNLEEVSICITKLKSFAQEDLGSFLINPLSCLETIYNFFKYGIIKRDALADLSASFYNIQNGITAKNCATNDMIFILGLYTGMFFDNPKKLLRVLDKVKLKYKDDTLTTNSSEYGFFIKVLYAEIYFKQGQIDLVNKIYYDISANYKKDKHQLSPYMKTLFTCLKVRVLLNSERESLVIAQMRSVYLIGEQSGSKLSKFISLGLIVARERIKNVYPEFYKQSFDDHRMMVTKNGLSKETFLKQDVC